MAPIPYDTNAGIGTATLVCGWVFGALALVFLSLYLFVRWRKQELGLEACLLVVATIISIALTIQTNWAVADEGEGNHVEDEFLTEVVLVAKVSCLKG